nr:DUF368 domain-containing protein [Sinobaca sp. H24]
MESSIIFSLTIRGWYDPGFIGGIFFLHHVIEFYPKQTFSLFTGLIIGMIPSLWKNAVESSNEAFRFPHYTLMALVFAGVASLGLLTNDTNVMQNLTAGDYAFLFFSGWIASTALVLQG